MTKREIEILNLIKENSMLSQIQMASRLGITRSSIAVHLSNLVKKGYLKGKGYIINDDSYVCVIGAANIDLVGFSKKKLNYKDANLGSLKISMGGVGRNIAENLMRLGVPTKLICAFGDDFYGKQLVEHSQKIGLDISDSLVLKNMPSPVHMAIMDVDNDLALGLSNMEIYDNLTIDFIRKKSAQIKNAKLVVLDTNLPEDVLMYIVDTFPEQVFLLDTVSGIKSLRAKNILSKLDIVKVNIIEAAALSGIKITKQKHIKEAVRFFHEEGIQKVFVTMGEKGVFYCENNKSKTLKPKTVKVKNTNGAGDAFVAGVAYAYIKNFGVENMAKIAMACAEMTIKHVETVNPNISESSILKVIENDK